MNRRGFLLGAVGLIVAPSIVHASSLMPIRVWKERLTWVPCDGRWLYKAEYVALWESIGHRVSSTMGRFQVPDLNGNYLVLANRSLFSDGSVCPIGLVVPGFVMGD